MFKKFYDKIKKSIINNYNQIIIILVGYLILAWPVNYYIIVGGGISDINSRISINNSYKSSGSFNISYVSELKGNTLTYLLSFIIPDWKRTNMNEYKYNSNENYKDLEFRSNIELDGANDNSIKNAYELAHKEYKIIDSKIYITGIVNKYNKKLKIRDQLISIDNNKYDKVEDYKKYLQNTNNKSVLVKVLRNNKEKEIKCKLYTVNNTKILGITLEKVNNYKTDPKIKIKFKDSESGPSGGLITTLDIYNKLTKKDITQSLKIAGTGTVDYDGNVGEIGEVKYKLLGAVKGKADIFLVPSGNNYKTCMKIKKARKLKIKIIEVKNIKEAIEKLDKLKSQ